MLIASLGWRETNSDVQFFKCSRRDLSKMYYIEFDLFITPTAARILATSPHNPSMTHKNHIKITKYNKSGIKPMVLKRIRALPPLCSRARQAREEAAIKRPAAGVEDVITQCKIGD